MADHDAHNSAVVGAACGTGEYNIFLLFLTNRLLNQIAECAVITRKGEEGCSVRARKARFWRAFGLDRYANHDENFVPSACDAKSKKSFSNSIAEDLALVIVRLSVN